MKRWKLVCLALGLVLAVGTVTETPAGAAKAPSKQVLTAKITATNVKVGTRVHIKGKLLHAPPKALLRLQRYYRGAWHNFASRHLAPPSVIYDFWFAPDVPGVLKFRVLSSHKKSQIFHVTAHA